MDGEKVVLDIGQEAQIGDPAVDQNRGETDFIESNNNDESEDDEFGDFEEVDQADANSENLTKGFKLEEIKLSSYDGNYKKSEDSISRLLSNIFDGIPVERSPTDDSGTNTAAKDDKYILNERAAKVFAQLVADDDKFASHLIWKKSMIFKQLMLNLDIPIESINQISGSGPHTGSTNSTTEFRDLYDRENTLNVNSELEKLLKQVPDFKTTGIDKKTDEFNDRISNTTSVITDAHHIIKKQSDNDEKYLIELITIKKKLLELLSVWDERMSDIQADNDLFSSYVENLIGNTQKFRRVSRLAK